MKRGLIVNNIGTPEAPTAKAVKRYLDEFLMDPEVITAPFPIRFLLVKGLITPRRSPASAKKYAEIWMERGSPLRVFTEEFVRHLAARLGPDWSVKIGMRYGKPSIADALRALRDEGVGDIVFAPMYPQFARSTTGSAESELRRRLNEMSWDVPLRTLKPFHADQGFLGVQSEMIRPYAEGAEHLLFSFHGLPERHVRRMEGCLASSDCCERPRACAAGCYRAQCLRTAADLAWHLSWPEDRWSASFQSRLGPTRWIGPSTDEVIRKLAAEGVRRLTVVCPSFVTDGLETLEEIGLGAREDFLRAGGESFRLVPCLNADPEWVDIFIALVKGSSSRSAEESLARKRPEPG